jgi:hypothetical protein
MNAVMDLVIIVNMKAVVLLIVLVIVEMVFVLLRNSLLHALKIVTRANVEMGFVIYQNMVGSVLKTVLIEVPAVMVFVILLKLNSVAHKIVPYLCVGMVFVPMTNILDDAQEIVMLIQNVEMDCANGMKLQKVVLIVHFHFAGMIHANHLNKLVSVMIVT